MNVTLIDLWDIEKKKVILLQKWQQKFYLLCLQKKDPVFGEKAV